MKKLFQNLGVACGTVLFCFLIAEGVCRAGRVIARRQDLSIPLLMRSEDPELEIELRPGGQGEILGKQVSINEHGFRDPDWNDGALSSNQIERILVVGDSVPFGWGMAESDVFPRLLQEGLQRRGKRVRVYNVSVPGYGLRHDVRLLQRFVPMLRPAKVLVAYCLNDPDPAGASTESFHLLNPPLFETWHLLSRLWDLIRFKRSGLDYHEYIHQRGGAALDRYFQSLREMKRSGVDLTLVILPVFLWNSAGYPYEDIHRDLAVRAAAAGIPVIDLLPPLQSQNAQELGLDLWHPTAAGHRLIAEALSTALSPAESAPAGNPHESGK